MRKWSMFLRTSGACAVSIMLLSVFFPTKAAATDVQQDKETPAQPVATWTQWRGPHRDGYLVGSQLPESLKPEVLKLVWQQKRGPSYSGPIVGTKQVFVTETVRKTTEVVRALDRSSGKQLWEKEWSGSLTVPFFARSNGSWIRSTPTLDGNLLFVAGIRDLLICLDITSGNELWRLHLSEKLQAATPTFGCVSSPLVIGEHVYVQAGGGFCKIEKLTGEIKWRVLEDGGGMYGSAFSSPVYTELDGKPQILVQTRTKLAGVGLQDGKVFWSQNIPAFRGMNILTPIVYQNSIFTSTYGGRSFFFTASQKDSRWQVSEAWTNKIQGYMSSPLVIDGHLYLHLRNQRFACLDLASGKETWITRPFGKYWSMATDGKKILALDQRGELLLIKANPDEFELIDRRKVTEDSWAHIAVCGNEIFVRALDGLMKFRWE